MAPVLQHTRHAGLAASKMSRVYWQEWVTAGFSRFEPLDYHILGVMLKKYHKLEPEPYDKSWKSRSRQSMKGCHKNTSARRWRTSLSAWLPAWLPVMVHLQVCILISLPTDQSRDATKPRKIHIRRMGISFLKIRSNTNVNANLIVR